MNLLLLDGKSLTQITYTNRIGATIIAALKMIARYPPLIFFTEYFTHGMRSTTLSKGSYPVTIRLRFVQHQLCSGNHKHKMQPVNNKLEVLKRCVIEHKHRTLWLLAKYTTHRQRAEEMSSLQSSDHSDKGNSNVLLFLYTIIPKLKHLRASI